MGLTQETAALPVSLQDTAAAEPQANSPAAATSETNPADEAEMPQIGREGQNPGADPKAAEIPDPPDAPARAGAAPRPGNHPPERHVRRLHRLQSPRLPAQPAPEYRSIAAVSGVRHHASVADSEHLNNRSFPG